MVPPLPAKQRRRRYCRRIVTSMAMTTRLHATTAMPACSHPQGGVHPRAAREVISRQTQGACGDNGECGQ
jgi:hypothetical protein